MKIESLLRRKGGTKVTLDGIEYHFKPDANGREYADVTNDVHIGVFLAIPEGYQKAGAVPAKAEPAAPSAPPVVTLKAPIASPALDQLDRKALSDLYAKRFGNRPPPRLSEAKILEALDEGSRK